MKIESNALLDCESSEIINIEEEPCQPTFSADGIDLTVIRWMLSLTPLERLRVAQRHASSTYRLRDARKRI